MYVNCHTYYSLRFGTFSEVGLLELAKENDIETLALTDINNTSACLNFIRKSNDYSIKPVIGIDFRNGNAQQYVGLAKNNMGFQELNEFLSYHSQGKKQIPHEAPNLSNVFFIYPFENVLVYDKTTFQTNEFIGVSVEELKKLPFSNLKKFKDKLVIQQQVTIRNNRDFNAHRLLRAIDKNTLLSKLDKSEQCRLTDKMMSKTELLEAFSQFPHIITNTEKLLQSCNIYFDFGNSRISQNQREYLNSKEEDYELLAKLCEEGLPRRYSKVTDTVKNRLKTELKTIKEMDFVSYFLINHDIVSYSKRKGYIHVGRGSGANSIIAYIIGITDVDPIELDLYFERFINPYRSSPPDFDIDFSWKERDDVTKYIFQRFKYVALLATYNTFKKRAVVRELGKVFGMP